MKKKIFRYCLILLAAFAAIYWLSTLKSNGEPVYTKKALLNTSLPIYTQQVSNNYGAMVCPSNLLFDSRIGYGPKALFEAKHSILNHQKQIADVGCEEWKGGIRLYFEPDELKRLNELQAQDKSSFIYFQLLDGVSIQKVIFSGDLTNAPSGKY